MSSRRFLVCLTVALAINAAAGAASAQNHAEHYILDGFGGVHAGGGAPAVSPGTPYFGFDVAADIAYVAVGTGIASGNGILVLDRFGGVHKGGALAADPPVGATPYFGFDIARAVTLRDVPPRAAAAWTAGGLVVTDATFAVLASATIRAPDDGFLVVTGTAQLQCSGTNGVHAEFAVAVDGTTPLTGLETAQEIPNCAAADVRTFAITHMFPVAAGTHTVNAVARRIPGASATVTLSDRSVTVLFIDRDANGSS